MANTSQTGFKDRSFTTGALGDRIAHSDNRNGRPKYVFFGDSVIWGHGVSDHETVPWRIGQLEPTKHVLNLGVSGFGLDQMYLRFKLLHKKIGVALYIFYLYVNDFGEALSNATYGKRKPYFTLNNDSELVLQGIPISPYSCQNIWSRSWLLSQNTFLRSQESRFCTTVTVSFDVIKPLLHAIKKEADTDNSRLVFVVSPCTNDFLTPVYASKIEDVLGESGLPFLSLQKALLPRQNEEIFSMFLDGAHYSSAGGEVIAQLVNDYLQSSSHKD